MGHPEQDFQITVAQYLDRALPREYAWTAIGHGGGGRVRGGILKAMGVKPGWSDIIILKPSHIFDLVRFIGLELKSERGALSQSQRDVRRLIKSVGGMIYVCRTMDEVEGALRAELIPLRARVAA